MSETTELKPASVTLKRDILKHYVITFEEQKKEIAALQEENATLRDENKQLRIEVDETVKMYREFIDIRDAALKDTTPAQEGE